MSPTTRRVLNFKNLKLELINAYRKNGQRGIEKILEKNTQVAYLKRHKMYKSTVLMAENMCKQWIHETMITNQP
jgi:hypothetical protein